MWPLVLQQGLLPLLQAPPLLGWVAAAGPAKRPTMGLPKLHGPSLDSLATGLRDKTLSPFYPGKENPEHRAAPPDRAARAVCTQLLGARGWGVCRPHAPHPVAQGPRAQRWRRPGLLPPAPLTSLGSVLERSCLPPERGWTGGAGAPPARSHRGVPLPRSSHHRLGARCPLQDACAQRDPCTVCREEAPSRSVLLRGLCHYPLYVNKVVVFMAA